MIELKNISKSYNNKKVLDNVNLKFGSFGLTCIVGKSGSGKSTLLNMIGLLDYIDEGSIMIDGNNINNFKKKDINWYHNSYVGIIFQQYNLFDDMTVIENINLFNKYDDTEDILDKLNISELKDKKVKDLSGGEKQRVAIARALVKKPKVLLCDEPTGALDSYNAKIIMDILKDISKDILVICVSHDVDLVNTYADNVIKINDGKVNGNSNVIVDKLKDINNNNKIKLSNLIKLVKVNLNNKKKRNILTIIAFSIGLMSLAIVLGIKNGFNNSLDKANQEYLSKYPLYISSTSTNLDNDLKSSLNSNKTDSSKIYALNEEHINKIDNNYLNYLNNSNLISSYIYTYIKDNIYIKTYNDFIKDHVVTLMGLNYINEFESIIVLDSNNKIAGSILSQIGLDHDTYNYEELVGYKYKIDDQEYTVKGVVRLNDDYTDIISSGIYYNYVTSDIPDEIYIYANSYDEKNKLCNYLDQYDGIEYTDIASTITNVSKTLMNALSIILICFSVISLIVSTIMISILSYISIIERVRDIGILKSMGLSNSYIKLLFYLENIWICGISGVISLEFIDLISVVLNKILYNITGLDEIISLSFYNYVFIIVLSLLLSLIGSFIPLNKIKKYTIVDTLKYE